MRIRRSLDFAVDVAAVGVAALVAIFVAGRTLNSDTAHRLDAVPVAGDVVAGLRALVDAVYNPASGS